MKNNEANPIILFDGVCNLCNSSVNFIIKHDPEAQFLFASLQSEFGQKFLNERGLENKIFSTLYLWKPNVFYLKKSQAALKIARILGGKFAIIGNFNFFPVLLSDYVYDQIAKNRTKLASQKCFLPNEKERAKFVQ